MLHQTSRFRIRRMVQAQLFRKSNPDAHYANAVYKFMREQAVKNCQNIDFFSADAKCKVPIGEPGYPIAAVTRGKNSCAMLIPRLCDANKTLRKELAESLDQQKRLLEHVFKP